MARWFSFGKSRGGQGGESPKHLKTGVWGERVATNFLKKKGYTIIGQRVRIGTRDEIDLIARDGQSLVFVEVKTRASERYGRPLRAVDRKKRHTLSRGAIRYVRRLRNPRVTFRFDVVEVVGCVDSRTSPTVRHIRNAFPLDRRYMLP